MFEQDVAAHYVPGPLMRILMLCIALLFAFDALAVEYPHSDELRVEISCDKSAYLDDESIWVDVLLINISSRPLEIPFPLTDIQTIAMS